MTSLSIKRCHGAITLMGERSHYENLISFLPHFNTIYRAVRIHPVPSHFYNRLGNFNSATFSCHISQLDKNQSTVSGYEEVHGIFSIFLSSLVKALIIRFHEN